MLGLLHELFKSIHGPGQYLGDVFFKTEQDERDVDAERALEQSWGNYFWRTMIGTERQPLEYVRS